MKKSVKQQVKKAIQSNNSAEAVKLCRGQPDVDEAARVAIVEAISIDQSSVVEQLLPMLKPSWESEPLKTAAKLGKAELVKKLIPLCDATDDATLCVAARHGHVECVKLLLRDCNPLQGNSQALYEAALHGHADVVFQLVLFSDAKAQDSRALIAACREGHLEAVKHLLPFSSKIQCAQHGFAAASENNHVDVVEFLIEAGLPDPEDTYALGLNVAAAKGHATLVESLLWAIVRTGHAPRDFGEKALFAAATKGDAGMVKSILEFAHKTAYPEAGLFAALQNDHDEVADVLVRRVNLDHVRELISDEEIEAKLDEAIARLDAAKQHRELQSNERKRVAQSEAVSSSAKNSSRSARL
ncbi:ankyrin repeat domain-containing protein [Xanthomonas campestris pv. incanae]|uniref:ankyrin repeat domain-containing protein n=1 Tax=Xanthomonas campestris TaxID=339 RepID=UPI0023680863|nr:ankyrin repeat domain-containing protein [Xanthomonas campestris]WDJ86702.1 ankyrin repeat domain-containing protein [Xanthomonas campestris pv. incanae]WDK24177.1 ankyrin repeat domain-containing protein [Xanthomonas campestris pv. incanae]